MFTAANWVIPFGAFVPYLRPIILLLVNTPLYTRYHADFCHENMSSRTKNITRHCSNYYVWYSLIVTMSYWFWQSRPEIHSQTNLLSKILAIIYHADIYQTYLFAQYGNRPWHGVIIGSIWQGLDRLHPLEFVQAFLDHSYVLYHPEKTTIMKKILICMYLYFAAILLKF